VKARRGKTNLYPPTVSPERHPLRSFVREWFDCSRAFPDHAQANAAGYFGTLNGASREDFYGMTDVSLAGAFLAGLISFLSPCVLPLVPGYISMLSGIGVEQLRQGEQPKGGLLSSALSFVTGFFVADRSSLALGPCISSRSPSLASLGLFWLAG